MNRRFLAMLGIRALVAWVVVGSVLLAVRLPLMTLLLPYFDLVIRLLQSDFSPSLRMVHEAGSWMIQMTPFLLRPVGLTDQLALRPFIALEPISVHVDHALVPLVLLVTAAASWPLAGRIEALVRVLLAVPAVAAALALTTPVLLAGRAQMSVVELALMHGASFHEPALVTLLIFMESGGRWLLALALAVACVVPAQRLCRPALPAAQLPRRPRAQNVDTPVFAPVGIQRTNLGATAPADQ
jgi:hypothetical protein